ncbi:MAG: LssY C-terminal domain-containing protein [Cypionkella sp.]
MTLSLQTLLPSLSSLGVWGYWIVGAASALEAYFLTGIFIPGTLVVDAGGLLAQRGVFDFWDLVWFVAIGSILGTEASYWTGRFARNRLTGRLAVHTWPAYARAERLFQRRGGLALVIGRFLGPVAGLVPLVAALAGMERRKFLLWSIIGSIPYAVSHVALGYFLGDVMTRMGPALTRTLLIAGGVVFLVLLLLWLVWRVIRSLPRILAILGAVLATISARPEVERLRQRFPRVAAFLARRVEVAEFTGLPLSALAVIFVYILTVWLDSVFEFLRAAPILLVDERLAELIHVLWTPGLLRLAAHVTALGDARVIIALAVAAAIWLLLRGRRDLAAGLVLSIAGNQASISLLKVLFERPRPALAYFVETSGSFPSGHAAISVAFYGMVAFAFWRMGRLGPMAATVVAVLLAGAIGLSRVYLIEHYLTDVLNGWLVGGMWLVAGVTFSEWWHASRPTLRLHLSGRVRTGAGLVIMALVFGAGWTTARFDKALSTPPAPEGDISIAAPAALFGTGRRPVSTESLLGNPLEPINILILAKDEAALTAAMARAGWKVALTPSPSSLTAALWALVSNAPDLVAPVTPYFWAGLPNDYAFERAAGSGGPRKRHHVRIWDADAVLPDAKRVFAGAASYDDGLDHSLLHHIAPDLDAERDQLAADLIASGVAKAQASIPLPGPRSGTSVAGDPWFTNGMTAVLAVE